MVVAGEPLLGMDLQLGTFAPDFLGVSSLISIKERLGGHLNCFLLPACVPKAELRSLPVAFFLRTAAKKI